MKLKHATYLIFLLLCSCIPEGKYEKVVDYDGYTLIKRYENGVLHDTTKVYYPNGNLKEELPYRHGFLYGESTMFDSIGNVIAVTRYRNDTIIENRVYHTDGPLATGLLFFTYKDPVSISYRYRGDTLWQINYGHHTKAYTYQNADDVEVLADSVYYLAEDSMGFWYH